MLNNILDNTSKCTALPLILMLFIELNFKLVLITIIVRSLLNAKIYCAKAIIKNNLLHLLVPIKEIH